MPNQASSHQPCWIESDQPLPEPGHYSTQSAPIDPDDDGLWPHGLIAAGADLSAERLLEAYRKGLFPWFSEGQPVLWWSPDPRMVLQTKDFRLHRSLVKTVRQWQRSGQYSISINQAFSQVISACAGPRSSQNGTWITAEMQAAYCKLHERQCAHSIEIWHQAEGAPRTLIGGLYGVAIGRMFYGESMFAEVRDASKIALASLVELLGRLDMPMIDCQQNTKHLASLGAHEIPRIEFLEHIARLLVLRPPDWSAISIEFPAV